MQLLHGMKPGHICLPGTGVVGGENAIMAIKYKDGPVSMTEVITGGFRHYMDLVPPPEYGMPATQSTGTKREP